MTKRLDKSLKKFSKKKEERLITISGELGLPLGGQKLVEVPNRKGFVYVRLKNNTSEVIQAYNSEVSTIYGLAVLVARQNNIYKVIGRDLDRYRDWSDIPYLPKHGGQHSFNQALGMGADIVWVYPQQFMPLLGYPSGSNGSNGIIVAPHLIRDLSGNWKYVGNTGTPDISMYRPSIATGAVMVLVYIDTVSGNPYLLVGSGSTFHAGITGTNDIARYVPNITNPNWIPNTAVRLTSGTTQLTWANLYDTRPFLTPNNSIAFQDNGVLQGYANTINAGDNLNVTVSGTVAHLEVTGISENIYFLTSGSAGVSTYDLMTLGRPTGTYNFYSASISATGTLLADWITESGVPGADFISDGVYHLHVHAQKTAGTKDARLKYIFSKRTVGGVETDLHVSNLSVLIPSSETEIDVESFETEHSLSSTDRLVVKLYAFSEGVGSAPTIQIKIEGDTLSRFEIPAISSTSGQMSVAIQDEGVPQGSATTLNFVGDNVQATVAAGLARIFVTGTSGIPLNGWEPQSSTWIRTGNHTLLISGNSTGTYQKGTKLWWTDSGVGNKYGVVGSNTFTSGTTTTLNLIPTTDYIASGTISNPYISYVETPVGFPDTFNYTTTPGALSGTLTSTTVNSAKWKVIGKQIKIDVQVTLNDIGTGTSLFTFTPPIASAGTSAGNGRENQNTGKMLFVVWFVTESICYAGYYDNTSPLANTNVLICSIICPY